MAKNNIRSIRFSDDIANMIDRQAGSTFTEKFERLVTRAFWELPVAEKELERVNNEITIKREELRELSRKARELSWGLEIIAQKLEQIQVD